MPESFQSPPVKEAISRVRMGLNAVSLDKYLPAKYIHGKLLDTAKLFMKREGDDRRFDLYPSIWVTIDELEMEPSTLVSASIPVPHCERIMKSIKKLPEIYTTRYGYLANLSSSDYSTPYTQTTPRKYANIRDRRIRDRSLRYFWIENGHLVIPESFVEIVKLSAIFCNKAHGLRVDGCHQDHCISILDEAFTVPPHLFDDVIKATVMEIAGTREKMPPSEYPNLNEYKKEAPLAKG